MDDCNKCDPCTGLCKIAPEMAGKFKALGDPNRLQIIHLLSTDITGTLGVSDLAEKLGISQPAASQHLRTLKSEGFVTSRREGFRVYFSFNRDRLVQFREYFDLMCGAVMDRCDRELVRKTTQQTALNACVVFYSYTGVTRGVAGQLRNACGCDLVEVKTVTEYSAFTAYTTGVLHSRRGVGDPILPEEIDVSQYDLLVIGTPVWAWKPAPAINSAVRALKGCEGKRAVIFVTCSGQPGEALPLLEAALAARGVEVVAAVTLTKEEMATRKAENDLIERIVDAYPLPVGDGDSVRA
ncbi:metalloregulator ArsR/SmtB family transcription factor [Methanoculleus sp.]|uniref:metalloregulator ArsR/SmtB family transcription factor n=1 Tax=Methanoculleus sp. TaxID=90427 RepID=UPI001BD608B0|nr:metalloregulator ArsR/SmtB family transcription factor [Methanoculleus sp.]